MIIPINGSSAIQNYTASAKASSVPKDGAFIFPGNPTQTTRHTI